MFFEFYKKNFLDSETTLTWGGETVTRVWDDNTLYFYCGIVLIVILITFNAEKKRVKLVCRNQKYHSSLNKIRFYSIFKDIKFLFFILFIIMGCRHIEVGIDTVQYMNDIEQDITLEQRFLDSTTEPIYKILQHIFHVVFDNGRIGVFIYSFATLWFLFGGLKKFFGDINIYVSILAYVCIYYFPSFNLLRISLAASFIFYNFHFLLRHKYIHFIIIILFTSFIHYSSLVMFLPLFFYLIYKKNKVAAALIFLLLVIGVVGLVSLLANYVSLINRYSGYIDNNEASGKLGFQLIVDYLPCILISFYVLKNKIYTTWADLIVSFTASAFIVRMLAYFMGGASRLNFHFPILIMILMPYWIFYLKKHKSKFYTPMLIFCTVWALYRLHICFSVDLVGHGIMPYMFFWEN